MRFAAWRGLSAGYRAAVEGHTPWRPDTPNPEPLVVPDVSLEPSLAGLLPTIQSEGIAAMAFIPLVSLDRVIGKFMLYYDEPHALSTDELQLASLVAFQVAFAVERTRAEAQARRSEAAAEEASRLKDEFLATLSHELRTPLNAIFGWVQMLQTGIVSPERVRHAIDVIGRNTTLQARLIEDILDVSRIISGKLEIEQRAGAPRASPRYCRQRRDAGRSEQEHRAGQVGSRGPAAHRRRRQATASGARQRVVERGEVHARGRPHRRALLA